METTETILEEYYKAKIDHNHSNFHMIWEIVKKQRKDLRAGIHLFNKAKLPYSPINYLFMEKVAGDD